MHRLPSMTTWPFGLNDGLFGTEIDTEAAVPAELGIDAGMDDGVLIELSGARGTSHAQIFNRSAHAGLHMSRDMAQTDQDVGIPDPRCDPGGHRRIR
jgi:hypothetical protein